MLVGICDVKDSVTSKLRCVFASHTPMPPALDHWASANTVKCHCHSSMQNTSAQLLDAFLTQIPAGERGAADVHFFL